MRPDLASEWPPLDSGAATPRRPVAALAPSLSRDEPPAIPEPAANASESATRVPSERAALRRQSIPPHPRGESAANPGEAVRFQVPRWTMDSDLRAQGPLLREHFKGSLSEPFDVQRVRLGVDRAALLLAREGDVDPLVFAIDGERLDWVKRRPVAGMVSPVRLVTIAAAPERGVALFVWIPSLRMVAARMWASDGDAIADLQVFTPSACDALSAAYAPSRGFWVACETSSTVLVERLHADGTSAWGPAGLALGMAGAVGPVTLLPDTTSSLVLLERVTAVGGDRLLAFRYDLAGGPLWPLPVELGLVARWPTNRLAAAVVSEGLVRVWPKGKAGRFADVAITGEVAWRSP